MSRNGAGVYSAPTNSWNPATVGVAATAVDWQSILNDLSAALTQSVSRDGQSTMTGNLPMGGNKLTGLGAGTGTGDSLRFEQLFDQGIEQDVASAATTDIGVINSNFIRITGTTTITSFGTTYKGPRFVRFGGILTLAHNATTLILPTCANITTAAGDRAIITPIGNPASGWQVLAYQRADGSILSNAYALLSGASFTGNVSVPSINGGQLAGTRNKIINGRMDIAQRGTSFPAIASGAFIVDRFKIGNTSTAVLTGAQQLETPSNEFQYSLRTTITTADTSIAAGESCVIDHPIEGWNARDLIARAFTLSFWVRSSKTGVHCVAFRNSGADRSYVAEYTISAANTWEFKTVTVSVGLPITGTWDFQNGLGLLVRFTLASGTTTQTTAGAWQTGSFLSTANQVNCLDTIGNIFAITGVQLEVGSVATPFEHRFYGQELASCRRYTRIQAYQVPATTAQNLGTIDMRTTPTITGGGAGFTSTGTTSDQLIAFQTASAVQTLTLVSEL